MALTRITKGVIKPNENYDTNNINSTGIVTAIGLDINGNGDVSGNLSVGGVLTYEDVTSIDSVGIITARNGIDCNGDIDVDGHTNLDNVSVAGVTTFSNNVHVGTGVTIETNGQAEIAGITTFYKDVHIKTSTGRLYVGATDRISLMADPSHSYLRINGGHFQIHNNNFGVRSYDGNGSTTLIYAPTNDGSGSGGVQLYHNNGSGINPKRFQTTTQGIEVLGHSELDNVNIAGVSTVANFLQVLGQAGTSDKGFEVRANSTQNTDTNKAIRIRNNSNTDTFNISYKGKVTATELDISGNIDVDGHTNLDNVSIAGVSTFSGNVKIDAGTSTTLTVEADSAGVAMVKATGGSGAQATAAFELVQSTTSLQGGGISYNGDGSPSFASGETADATTFYRILNGSRYEVFSYPYNSDTVTFNSTVIAPLFQGNLSGTVNTAAQPNITSLGTLSSLTVSGAGSPVSFTHTGGNCVTFNRNSKQLAINANYAGQNGYSNITMTSGMDIRWSLGGLDRFNFKSAGHIEPVTDSQINLGANAKRFANLYADTLYGDGSNLTGITQTTINNNGNNRVITGSGSANTLEAEDGFLYNGVDEVSINHVSTNENSYLSIVANANRRKALQFKNGSTIQGCIGLGDSDEGTSTSLFLSAKNDPGGATPHMTISTNGNLLLGTTTDTQRLHVYNGNGGTGYKTALFDSNDTANGTRVVITNSGNTSNRGLGIMVGGNYAGTDRASFGWFNNNSTFVSPTLMTIQSDGKIGIGRNDPVNFVDIARGSDEENILIVRGADNTTEYGAMGIHSGNCVITGGGAGSTNTGIMFRTAASGNETNRLLITSAGNVEPATDNQYDLGSLTKRWGNIYIADLNLSNEGSKNDVDGTWGQYTIQEGQDDLFLINKRNGKKYMFVLKEVS